MTTSIRLQILDAAVAALDAEGGPGLTVARERMHPIEKESLPVILVYAEDDAPKPLAGQQYGAPMTERQLTIVCECRALADAVTAADAALDPLLVWTTKQIVANEKFGGLANGVEEGRTVWLSREGEVPVAAAAIHFTVKYRTARADLTSKS